MFLLKMDKVKSILAVVIKCFIKKLFLGTNIQTEMRFESVLIWRKCHSRFQNRIRDQLATKVFLHFYLPRAVPHLGLCVCIRHFVFRHRLVRQIRVPDLAVRLRFALGFGKSAWERKNSSP